MLRRTSPESPVLIVLGACTPDPADPARIRERFADEAAPFEADDHAVAAPGVLLADPEFDPFAHELAFATRNHELWVGGWDPVTGVLDPPDGRGTLVDTNVVPFGVLLNGPEWAQGPDGGEVVYARWNGEAYVLMRAWRTSGGWATGPVDGIPVRVGSIGSQERGDPDPRIVFLDLAADAVSWSHLDGRPGGVLESGVDGVPLRTPRFTLGDHTLTWAAPVDGVPQVHHFDPDTGALEVLTDGPEGVSSPWMWVAPEYGERLFLATRGPVEAPVALDVYRRFHGRWTVILTLWPPADLPFVLSPEPWISGGRSLLVFQASADDGLGAASQLWVASATPEGGELRRVDAAPDGVPSDPEWVDLAGGAAVFYSNQTAAGVSPRLTTTGLP